MLDNIDWPSAAAQGLAGGGAALVLILAGLLLRAIWRALAWLFGPGRERVEKAERAALTVLIAEAEQRGYRRGWREAVEAKEQAAG